jgi:peptidoglycan glycosyltransferase
MNKQITRLAVAGLILLAALIVGTTYWQTWAAAGLADRQDNAIQRVHQFSIKRGLIRAADGTILAANTVKHVDGQTLYFRRYPTGPLFAHLVGYSTQVRSRAGLEQSENDYLTASNANLGTVLNTALDQFMGTTVKGNDVILTVRTQSQRIAMRELAGKCGAAVALDPRTGKVFVLASQPSYNPNLVERNFARIALKAASCSGAAPLLNRATNGVFTPGSTFKVVTTTSALQSGRYTPDSFFEDPGYCEEYGKRVYNAGSPDGPGAETFGPTNLTGGLVHSINSVFCNIGKAIGAGRILDTAKHFGFYARPPLETPANERAASGLYSKGKLYDPSNPATQVDPGRLAFGQERLLVSPLQMAMVGAAVANGGRMMRPYVVDRIVSSGGGTVVRFRPRGLRRVMSPTIASEISSMMVQAVSSGTGTSAQIPGVQVAGKTGTAETGVAGTNTTWFMCFAPADHPRFVVAVVLENQHGFGGTTAAPIAKTILQALLAGKSNP